MGTIARNTSTRKKTVKQAKSYNGKSSPRMTQTRIVHKLGLLPYPIRTR